MVDDARATADVYQVHLFHDSQNPLVSYVLLRLYRRTIIRRQQQLLLLLCVHVAAVVSSWSTSTRMYVAAVQAAVAAAVCIGPRICVCSSH